jgi:hypothetical protein
VSESKRELVLDTGEGSPRRISLRDVAERTPPTSAMPPTALGLTPRELRDLVAYLQTR